VSCSKGAPSFRFNYPQRARLVEPFRQAAGELGWHVLNHQNRGCAAVGNRGTMSASARGPPVLAAIATTSRARTGPATDDGGRGARSEPGRASGPGSDRPPALRSNAAINAGPISSIDCRVDSRGLATISTAPSSNARIAAAVPGPACALTTTTGRGVSLMMYPMAPMPSSSGISMSW